MTSLQILTQEEVKKFNTVPILNRSQTNKGTKADIGFIF